MQWSTACPSWETKIVSRQSLVPCPPLFPGEAKAALEAFKALRVVDVAGSPTFADAGDPWIFDFVAAVFGAYDAKAGKRLIREFFLCVSKKNGKSTLAAGIMLTALIRNWRKSNELLIVAPTIEAAQNSFKPAADMVRADPKLDAAQEGFLLVQDHLKTITHLKTRAVLKVVAADSRTVGGKKAGFVLIDELWEFGKQANADSMLREATGGLVSRPEGFVISITTQSDASPGGVFKDKLSYARQVRDGKIADLKFMPVIYEFPKRMLANSDYLKPENFYVTNPNLGHSVSLEWLEDEMRKELARDAGTRNTFLAKHLNVEIGIGLQCDRWAGADFWARRGELDLSFDDFIARCELVVAGLDGGGLDDLYGFYAIGRERRETEVEIEIDEGGIKRRVKKLVKRWIGWGHAWCHSGVLERRKSIASVLRGFAAMGDLTIVDDELADISGIVDLIERIKDAGILYCVAVDPAGLGEMIDALAQIEITEENKENERNFVIGAKQGYAMMNAIKTAERKLANGTFVHADQSMMDWCVGNVKIEPLATAIRATKQNAGDAKIDPWMAMMNCASVMQMNPQPPAELQIAAMVA